MKAKLTFPISILVGYFRDSPGPKFLRALMGQKDDCGVQEEDGAKVTTLDLNGNWGQAFAIRITTLTQEYFSQHRLVVAGKINFSMLEPFNYRKLVW